MVDTPRLPAQPPMDDADHAAAASKLRTAGQRRVNLIWESTQATIALGVTGTTLYVTANTVSETAFALLSNGFFLVIGFYFGRTNHQKTGGIDHR